MKQKMNGILIKCLILAALAGFVFVACKSDSGEVQSFDEDPPHVVSFSPGDSSTDVSVNTSITVSFDEAMYPSTVSYNSEETNCSGGVQLSKDGFFSCVSLSQTSLTVDPGQMVFSISPLSPLEGFTNYKIKISTATKDLALNPLEQDFVSAAGFTTGAGEGQPINNAQTIYFGDENTTEFYLKGEVEIVRAVDESGISGYNLYWGSSENDRLAGEPPLNSFWIGTGDLYNYYHFLDNVPIPTGATHFLVYSQNENGESSSPVFLDIPDTVLKMVADICPGGVGSNSNPSFLTEYAGKLFFTANDCDTAGEELWAYDASTDTLDLVVDIWPGSASSSPREKVEYNGKLYFQAQDESDDSELWAYNDIDNVAFKVFDINPSAPGSMPEMLTEFNGKLYFTADNGIDGNELWYHNDTTTDLAYDIDSSGDSSADGLTKYSYDNQLYFAANDGSPQNKFWSYDGFSTPLPNTTGNCGTISFPYPPLGTEFYEFNAKLFFRAYDATWGVEPWYYDGTDCYLLQNISDASTDSVPSEFTEYNGKLYFQAQDSFNGTELWVYDGFSATWMVSDIEPSGSSFPSFLTYFQNLGMLVFNARTDANGIELYGYDEYDPLGDPFMIADINDGTSDSKPEFLTIYNNRLYFAADDGINGNELWVFYSD